MVARGEAVGGEEAERLAAVLPGPAVEATVEAAEQRDSVKDDGGLVPQRH